jgi:hypothetical protein
MRFAPHDSVPGEQMIGSLPQFSAFDKWQKMSESEHSEIQASS